MMRKEGSGGWQAVQPTLMLEVAQTLQSGEQQLFSCVGVKLLEGNKSRNTLSSVQRPKFNPSSCDVPPLRDSDSKESNPLHFKFKSLVTCPVDVPLELPIYGSSMPLPVTTARPLSVPSSAYLYQPETLGNEFPVLTHSGDLLETLAKGLSSLDATSSAFSAELNPESMPLPPSSTSTLTHPATTQSILDPRHFASSHYHVPSLRKPMYQTRSDCRKHQIFSKLERFNTELRTFAFRFAPSAHAFSWICTPRSQKEGRFALKDVSVPAVDGYAWTGRTALLARATVPGARSCLSNASSIHTSLGRAPRFTQALFGESTLVDLQSWLERQLICTYICLYWMFPDSSPVPVVLRHLPYLKSLPPPDALLTPLQFMPSQLQAFRRTNIYGATRDRQECWITEWNTCRTFIHAVNPDCAERYTWYASPVFAFPTYPFLLPGMDILNHFCGQPVSWCTSYSEGSTEARDDSATISIISHTTTPTNPESLGATWKGTSATGGNTKNFIGGAFLLGQLFTSCHVLFWIPTRLQRGMEASDNVLLDKCFASAKLIIGQMIEVPTPSGLVRAAPDGHFVFASFASAFMLKPIGAISTSFTTPPAITTPKTTAPCQDLVHLLIPYPKTNTLGLATSTMLRLPLDIAGLRRSLHVAQPQLARYTTSIPDGAFVILVFGREPRHNCSLHRLSNSGTLSSSADWAADEEFLLIEGISQEGLGNWR
ncbi:uncharacterized protein F5891DRAFT_1258595 [Suillus fuscotomentosus]|uniref:Uncharacterized protein n=1 Tax=Suillus fuscotomentosus TaxID=1912939 RepID=A0AAD4DTL8_9AGAM|nr:uncharacterized protein F5891DRAFT_1258595 [Suillus fuscotomentosus]KAG1893559.1 hypothetical protein F5891DRAFT_1258595 [Suillus fuscotomentosus]